MIGGQKGQDPPRLHFGKHVTASHCPGATLARARSKAAAFVALSISAFW
jgi:hypothetical protein